MPVRATLHTTIDDVRCCKCKKSNGPGYYVQNGNVYKTCNECRAWARRRRRTRAYDNDEVNSANASLSLSSSSAADPTLMPLDEFGRAVLAAFEALGISSSVALGITSSASASATAPSAEYFVDEPMPEPEPERP